MSDEELKEMAEKANSWDRLEKQIEKFYLNSDGEYDEDNPEEEGDLLAIGELAARAFGFM